MNRIVISGYYGFANAGDEAVLAAMLASLRRQSLDLEPVVLSAAPEATQRLHGVPAVHRARPREVLGALRHCHLFISGGGSLLQDVTSFNSLLFYLAQIRLAKLLRRRVMIYAQGIGPLLRPAARRLTAGALRGVDWITVRDDESAAELRRLGLPKDRPPVEVAADPVFALPPAPKEWATGELRATIEVLQREERRPRLGAHGAAHRGPQAGVSAGRPALTPPLLGVSVRQWAGLEERLSGLAEAIRAASAELGLLPVYFPLQRSQDAPACRQLAERTGGAVLPGDYSPGEWMALAGRMELFLGMRLHALIFAAAQGVPLVGLTYDPKVTSLLARLGQAPATSLAEFDAGAVQTALCEMWNVRQQRSVQIAATARELAAAADLSARRAAELLVTDGSSGNRRT